MRPKRPPLTPITPQKSLPSLPPLINGGIYFSLIFGGLNVLLHGLGSYLLIVWYKSERKTPQKLLLINLAITELLFNMVALAEDAVKTAGLNNWFSVFNVATTTGINWMVMLAMFYITGDRLLAVLLNIKYDSYCSNRKAMVLITTTGGLGIIFSITVCALEYNNGRVFGQEIVLYVNPIILIAYLIFALVTYIVLFTKYLHSRRNMQRHADNTRISPWKAFVGSRFFIPVLLITSYLLLAIVPALARSVLRWMSTSNKGSIKNNLPFVVLSRLSYTVDAIIYIYLSKPVKKILLTKLICCYRDVEPNVVTEVTMATKSVSSEAQVKVNGIRK